MNKTQQSCNFQQQLLHELYNMITPEKHILFEKIAPLKSNYLTLVLEHIYQQHNASAILRSCESLGFQQLHVVEKDRQYNVQRDIARGAKRWVDIYHYTEKEPIVSCLESLKENGYLIVSTLLDSNGYTPTTIPIDKPIALIFGTEGNGVSKKAKELSHCTLHIPMFGFTQSFNVSVAAALCMYEIRQRLEQQTNIKWKLSIEEQMELKIKWCKRIIPHGEKVVDEVIKRLNIV